MEIEIVPMEEKHLDQVYLLEKSAFPSPWPKQKFEEEISDPFNRVYSVAEKNDKVVGYVGLIIILEEGRLTNLVVDPDFRRKKVASRLMFRLLEIARSRGVVQLTLEVRESNRAAINFYRNFGFIQAGRRKNYYDDTSEDAIIMWTPNIDSEEYRKLLKD